MQVGWRDGRSKTCVREGKVVDDGETREKKDRDDCNGVGEADVLIDTSGLMTNNGDGCDDSSDTQGMEDERQGSLLALLDDRFGDEFQCLSLVCWV